MAADADKCLYYEGVYGGGMDKVTYDNVGPLTFCFDKSSYTAQGSATFSVRHGSKLTSPAERPSPVSKAPEDPNGMLRLNARKHENIARAIEEHIRAEQAFRIKAKFKNTQTGEITSWDISVNARHVQSALNSDTTQFAFFSGFSSEYPVGTIDLTQC